MKEREANTLRVVERKSLLPRLIYLSIQTASASVKENFEVNGSICDPKVSSELKYLLDRYAKMLGFSLRDAIEVVSGVSSGLNSSEVSDCWLSDCKPISLLGSFNFISVTELNCNSPIM